MAVVCDYCPHEKNGKFSLQDAELSSVAMNTNHKQTHPTIDKSACPNHISNLVMDALSAVDEGWVTVRFTADVN